MSSQELIDYLIKAFQLLLLWQQNHILRAQNVMPLPEGVPMLNKGVRTLKIYWPLLVMIVLTLFTWSGRYYSSALNSSDQIPEFDDKREVIFKMYGPNPTGCHIEILGDAFLNMRKKYRITSACVVFVAGKNLLDTPYVWKGSAYDISAGTIDISVPLDDKAKALIEAAPTTYLILLIPKDVDISQVLTLRDARAQGVKIKLAGGRGGWNGHVL